MFATLVHALVYKVVPLNEPAPLFTAVLSLKVNIDAPLVMVASNPFEFADKLGQVDPPVPGPETWICCCQLLAMLGPLANGAAK